MRILNEAAPRLEQPRKPLEGDPIGCPVSHDEMIAYLNQGLSFTVLSEDLELIRSPSQGVSYCEREPGGAQSA
jgi:hypothetical protein